MATEVPSAQHHGEPPDATSPPGQRLAHMASASLTDGAAACEATSLQPIAALQSPDAAQHERAEVDDRPVPPGAAQSNCCMRQTDAGEKAEPGANGKPTPPAHFTCPISYEIMSDPVMIATGHTYDRACIEKWIASGHRSCPLSGQKLRHSELVPNIALRNIIQDWAVANDVMLPTATSTWQRLEVNPPNIHSGHDEIVWALEHRAGRVFSASADKTVRVWCPHEKRCLHVLEGHSRPVLSLASTQDALFSGSYDNSVRVWQLGSLQCRHVLEGHTDAVRALTTVGNHLFSGSYDHTVRAWRLPVAEHSGDSSGRDGADALEYRCAAVLEKHKGPVRALAGLQNLVFSGSYDETVCCWDAKTLTHLGQLAGHTASVRALATTSNLVFSGSDDATIRCWDAATLQCAGVLKGHQDNVRVLATSLEHPQLLISGSWDKTVHVWDVRAQGCARVLVGHSEAVLALAVGSEQLATGSYDTTVRFWDLRSLESVRVGHGHADAVRVLAAVDDKIVSGAYDGSIGIWP